jgi:hypothetical protein
MSDGDTAAAEIDEWMPVLDGRTGPDQDRVLTRGMKLLGQALSADPSLEEAVAELIERRMVDERPGRDTWTDLDEALTVMLGRQPALLFAWLAIGDSTRVDTVLDLGPPAAAAFVRSIMGRFGPELRLGYDVWRRLPDDWRTFFRDVYHDQLLNQPFLRVRLLKYSGEEVLIEGSPNSFLTLTKNLILTLQSVATPDVFTDDSIDSFDEEARRLLKQLIPDQDLNATPATSTSGDGAAAATPS